MKIIAHRGACTEDLENSWGAFEKAIACYSDRIELDVHLTADNELVINHDKTFERTGNSNKSVFELKRSEIESSVRLKNGEKVPFLDEVFERFLNKVEINVELKNPRPETIPAITKLIRSQKDPTKVIVSSFDIGICESLARSYPDIKVALLWERSLWWPGAFLLGPGRILHRNNIRIFHPDVSLVTEGLVSYIKRKGWQIIPYVSLKNESDPESLWSFLMTVGVDGLCTNYPRQLKLWLEEASDDSTRFKRLGALGSQVH